MFDASFLLSSWTCIYGRGCQGVLTGPAPELAQGCCSYGAHFTGDEDIAATRAHAERLRPDVWQFADEAAFAGGALVTDDEGVTTTRLVDGACIFLNRPGWPGGAGCALHQGALAAGERPLDWKPDVCWQLPLRQVDHTDDHGWVTSTVRDWRRRDWGSGGHEFHWWCTEAPDAFAAGTEPVYRTSAAELVELVGPVVYGWLRDELDRRRAGPSAPLPHRAAPAPAARPVAGPRRKAR